MTKPLLMPVLGTAFAASLADVGVHDGGLLRGATVVGQALSGVGDIALLGPGRASFLCGLGAFLGAHLAYTTAFVAAGVPAVRIGGSSPGIWVEPRCRQRSVCSGHGAAGHVLPSRNIAAASRHQA